MKTLNEFFERHKTLTSILSIITFLGLLAIAIYLFIPNVQKILEKDLQIDTNASRSKRIERVE